jgi:hypothetical protein
MNWDEIAHRVFEDDNDEHIKADATHLAKYGAPSVAVVTVMLTTLLGNEWNVDPSRPAVLFTAAIIIAAVVAGTYYAFATDIRTRGAVTVARFEAIATLAQQESDPPAANANEQRRRNETDRRDERPGGSPRAGAAVLEVRSHSASRIT